LGSPVTEAKRYGRQIVIRRPAIFVNANNDPAWR